ncbi:hypothetical protein J416_00409 [Gracilibacillus halophilus YIM-C55.5]|uniref:Lipoprotein n=1 Tax=Gracilibacillus halophilus YIM-C55.5 TaxID=1308866 RepID=N4WDQ8_9BACI|nr:hypothetical protein [Gracilibacillus halophilus]ENH98403.1 hypothetical protein J416_00409 [Gracilibacillus halophilus YIM-C55.5]
MKRIGIILCTIFLVACGQNEQSNQGDESPTNDASSQILYENEIFQIDAVEGWQLDEPSQKTDGNVVFTYGKTQAIVTTVSSDESMDELKSKAVGSFSNHVEVIEEKEQYLAVQTNRKENIIGDIYFHQGSNRHLIVIFMTPEKVHEQNQKMIETFHQSISIKN